MDEPAVAVSKAQKGLYPFEPVWRGPPLDRGYVGRVHGNAVEGNDEAQALGLLDMELAFLRFEVVAGFLEGVQDRSHVVAVFIQCVRVYKDVVDIAGAEEVQVFAENVLMKC